MYDLIKTRQTPHTEPFVGMYLRATGNGQRIIKVHTYDPATRTGTVISWGYLTYGHIQFAKQAYVKPFTAGCSVKGNWWSVSVPNKGWNGSWAYNCIDIYSVFHDAGTAYDMGQRSGKAALQGPSYNRRWRHLQTEKQAAEYIERKQKWGCPFKLDRELELAWHDGYNDAVQGVMA